MQVSVKYLSPPSSKANQNLNLYDINLHYWGLLHSVHLPMSQNYQRRCHLEIVFGFLWGKIFKSSFSAIKIKFSFFFLSSEHSNLSITIEQLKCNFTNWLITNWYTKYETISLTKQIVLVIFKLRWKLEVVKICTQIMANLIYLPRTVKVIYLRRGMGWRIALIPA